jgi:hypothetical protein
VMQHSRQLCFHEFSEDGFQVTATLPGIVLSKAPA